MDIGAILGLFIGFFSILVGNILEGGTTKSIMGAVAFMIVVGGAFGATLVETPLHVVKTALKVMKLAFFKHKHNYQALVDEIVRLAGIARKDGLLALEKERENIQDPLLKDALKFAIDGLEPNLVQQIIEARTNFRIEEGVAGAKFWSQLGVYCPTIGIIGAVMGLIVVMNNLQNPEKIGPGIAVAFIATIYGVSFSNIVFMPLGNRIKALVLEDGHYFEMVKLGVRSIQQGTSPAIIASQLLAIVDQEPKEESAA